MEQERITHIGELDIHSYELGNGAPLVFFHGWSVNAESSGGIRQQLKGAYHVIAPSHIGFGKSSRLPRKDFGVADYAALYVRWLEMLNLSNVTLVGHSFGGAIAQVVASQAPKGTVSKLVLLDSLGVRFQRSESVWVAKWLQKEVRNLLTAPKQYSSYVVKPFLSHLLYRSKDLFTLSTLSKQLDVQIFAKEITVPTTIVWGAQDNFVPHSVGEKLQQCIPHSLFQTIPGGHDWPLIQPEKVAQFV